jgi:hypothetical protein
LEGDVWDDPVDLVPRILVSHQLTGVPKDALTSSVRVPAVFSEALCFLNYLAFLRPAADRAVSILPWVVSRSRSYGFLWACSIIQKNVRKDNPTPAYSPVSDRRCFKALVEVHWARRVQAPTSQISGPN